MNKIIPCVNQYVKPDKWPNGEFLQHEEPYSDNSFRGCQFRLPAYPGKSNEPIMLAVNIEVTGAPKWKSSLGCYLSRCRIEFVGDGEPSTFTGASIQSD